MKYACNRGGRWIDVNVVPSDAFPTLERLQKSFPDDQFVQVDDAVQNGDLVVGDGGYSPAPQPQPIKRPLELSGTAFHAYCATVLAQVNGTSLLDGMARLGDILAGMDGQKGLIRIAAVRYAAAGGPGGKYSIADVTTLLQALQAAVIVTAEEAAGIVHGWPEG